MTFNPLHEARTILNTTDLTNLDDIAEAIYTATPRRDIPATYRLLLRDVARDAIRLARMETDDTEPSPSPSPRQMPARSSRMAAIRAHHQEWLRQRVHAQGSWKMLGDCTIEDVLSIAEQRRETAVQNAMAAKYFEEIADRMERQQVAFVRDLEDAA